MTPPVATRTILSASRRCVARKVPWNAQMPPQERWGAVLPLKSVVAKAVALPDSFAARAGAVVSPAFKPAAGGQAFAATMGSRTAVVRGAVVAFQVNIVGPITFQTRHSPRDRELWELLHTNCGPCFNLSVEGYNLGNKNICLCESQITPCCPAGRPICCGKCQSQPDGTGSICDGMCIGRGQHCP
jgi:hypothetical protein